MERKFDDNAATLTKELFRLEIHLTLVDVWSASICRSSTADVDVSPQQTDHAPPRSLGTTATVSPGAGLKRTATVKRIPDSLPTLIFPLASLASFAPAAATVVVTAYSTIKTWCF
eukprot:jgi/Chlat1/399/Chrsp10S01529